MPDTWQAATARHRFSELIDAAADGHPQFVRRRDGREVVIVSKEYFDLTKPGLKSVLTSHRFGKRGDAFDLALQGAGTLIGAAMVPREPENPGDRPGHKRRQ